MLITSPAITPRCFTAQQLLLLCCLQFRGILVFRRRKILRLHHAAALLLLACSLVTIRSLRSMQMNLMQVEHKTRLFNAMDILQKAATIGLICFLLFFWQKTIFAFFLGLVIIEGAVLVQYLPALARRELLSLRMFDFSFFRTAVAFSLPLMAAEISWVVSGFRRPLFYSALHGIAGTRFLRRRLWYCNLSARCNDGAAAVSARTICMKVWNTEGKEATQKFLSRSLDQFVLVAVAVVCVAIVTSRDVIVLLASRKSTYSALPFLVIGLVLSAVTIFFGRDC